MERVYEEAFSEVDEIIRLMPIDLRSKIPMQFRQAISENKAKNYIVDIHEPLKEQELKEETVIILGLIYRDFLASPEERDFLQEQDAQQLEELENQENEKYDINRILKDRKNKKKTDVNTEFENFSNSLVLYKEPNFFKKIFNFIKNIFKKNKF